MTLWFVVISLGFVVLERVRPWRRSQPALRKDLLTDLAFILFNAYLFSRLFYGPLSIAIHKQFFSAAESLGIQESLNMAVMRSQPFWLQFICLFLIQDFLKWCIHNLLHRVSWLWQFHKIHHSVRTMDWLGNMRYHWMEVLVYNSLLFLPLSFLGFAPRLFFWIGLIEITIGHLNHSNVNIDLRWLRYFLNSPRMHIWHHAADEPQAINRNFGIVLSVWDWLFQTAYMPAGRSPQRLGFAGMETYPSGFAAQYTFPLSLLFRKKAPLEVRL